MSGQWSGTARPILPVSSLSRATQFYRAIGLDVEVYQHGGYAFVRGDGISIDLSATDGFDPFVMAGMAYVTVVDPDATHAGLLATTQFGDYSSLGEATLRERWAAAESLARITAVEDKPWGMREFAFADPDNNLVRVGAPLR